MLVIGGLGHLRDTEVQEIMSKAPSKYLEGTLELATQETNSEVEYFQRP